MITINGLVVSTETKPTHQALCDIYDYMKMFHFDTVIATFNGCVSQEITLVDCIEEICEKAIHNYKRGLVSEHDITTMFKLENIEPYHVDAVGILWEITNLPIEFKNAFLVYKNGSKKIIKK